MKNLKLYILALAIFFPASYSIADDTKASEVSKPVNSSKEEEFQKVVTEYREYVAKIPASVRDEVVEYRKVVANLNKEKRVLYRKLTQDAQDYLKQEQEYKKKLPMNKRKLLNDEN